MSWLNHLVHSFDLIESINMYFVTWLNWLVYSSYTDSLWLNQYIFTFYHDWIDWFGMSRIQVSLHFPSQNFGRLKSFWVILTWVTQCHASRGGKLLNVWKITQKIYLNPIANRKHQTTQNEKFFKKTISDFPKKNVPPKKWAK